MPLIFNDRPLFSEQFGRVCDELHRNSNENAISVEGLLTRINQAKFFENAYIISLLRSVGTRLQVAEAPRIAVALRTND